MSVRNARDRQRAIVKNPLELRWHDEALAIMNIVWMANKLARQSGPGRMSREVKIADVVKKNHRVLGESLWSDRLNRYAHEAQRHEGWVRDVESLGELRAAELEAGFLAKEQHAQVVLQLATLYRPFNHSRSVLEIGSFLVAQVVLGRLMKLDPQLVLVKPALNSYSVMGCEDFYQMIQDLMKLLTPLVVK
jgi:hypothetical protein